MEILAILVSFWAVCIEGHVQTAIRSAKIPVRGVNLGGWLVAENWINPDDALWDGVDLKVWFVSFLESAIITVYVFF